MWDLAQVAIYIESKYEVIYQSQLFLLFFI